MYVYLAYGSDDGNLAVYGSKKRAVEAAVAYCSESFNPHDPMVNIDDKGVMVYVDGFGFESHVEKFLVE